MKKCVILHIVIADKREDASTMKFREPLVEEEASELNLEEALDVECRYE